MAEKTEAPAQGLKAPEPGPNSKPDSQKPEAKVEKHSAAQEPVKAESYRGPLEKLFDEAHTALLSRKADAEADAERATKYPDFSSIEVAFIKLRLKLNEPDKPQPSEKIRASFVQFNDVLAGLKTAVSEKEILALSSQIVNQQNDKLKLVESKRGELGEAMDRLSKAQQGEETADAIKEMSKISQVMNTLNRDASLLSMLASLVSDAEALVKKKLAIERVAGLNEQAVKLGRLLGDALLGDSMKDKFDSSDKKLGELDVRMHEVKKAVQDALEELRSVFDRSEGSIQGIVNKSRENLGTLMRTMNATLGTIIRDNPNVDIIKNAIESLEKDAKKLSELSPAVNQFGIDSESLALETGRQLDVLDPQELKQRPRAADLTRVRAEGKAEGMTQARAAAAAEAAEAIKEALNEGRREGADAANALARVKSAELLKRAEAAEARVKELEKDMEEELAVTFSVDNKDSVN